MTTLMTGKKARLAWIVEGEELLEPDAWHVVAVVKSYSDPDGYHRVLVIQERELWSPTPSPS